MKERIQCPCCGNIFIGEPYDNCPVCDWQYDGVELDDTELFDPDFAAPNPIPLGKARELFAEGKNIWGEQIKRLAKK